MANYHVLDISGRDRARVVFHIPIPAGNNSAGIPFQQALAQYDPKLGSAVPWLQDSNPTEHAQILSGAVYEREEVVEFNANATDLEKRNVLDVRFTQLSAAALARLQEILRFWGLDRDVS